MNLLSRLRPGFFLALLLSPVFFMISDQALAQKSGAAPLSLSPRSERPEALTPRLRVSGAEEPVRLISLAIGTDIQSGFAESSLDMEFYNPNGRILEGELEFPLNPGQEISGLALDIGGELRQGVPVSKARGQEVFDEVARQKVDPALLEATRGNAYRLRVYPLPAKGKRRVVVRIMQPLEAEKGRLNYRLPLSFADRLDSISVEAAVVSPGGKVRAEAGNLGLKLEKNGSVFIGRAERQNISPEGWLDISLPASESLSGALSAARWQDKLYFSAAAHLAVPDEARKLPERVTILWDASGSGRGRDLAGEFALLDSYFQAFGLGEARLIVLRDKAEPPQNFKIKDGDWGELKTVIHGLVYDGATNLTDWRPEADCWEYLLFSDGLANYRGASGQGGFPRLASDQRLFAINSASTADYAALRGLAAGGALIDLAHEPPEAARAKLLREGARVRVLSADLAGAAEAVLGPESAYLTSAEGRGGIIRLAGWAKRGGPKEVSLQLLFPDGTSNKVGLPLPAWNEAPEFIGEEAPLAARLWGRYTIAGLESDYRTNKKAIARLGEQLGIVSRETSLIVLETAADYARYGVKPPASLKEQVEALGRRNKSVSGGETRLAEDRLFSLWQEKVAWWETDFKPRLKPERPAVSTASPGTVRREANRVYTGERISLDFQNEDINKVIRIIGEVSGKNIVVPDDVSALITVKLRDVPWDQALDIVLSSRNLGVEESGNVLTVYDLPTLQSIRAGRERIAAERQAAASVMPQRRPAARPESRGDEMSVPPILRYEGRTRPDDRAQAESSYVWDGGGASLGQAYDPAEVRGGTEGAAPGSSAPAAPPAEQPDDRLMVNMSYAPVDSIAPHWQLRRGARVDRDSETDKGTAAVGLRLKPWVSDAPYIARMREAKDEELYAVYLDEKPDYLNSSAFFIDVADRFLERGLTELGLRVLSNLAEMQLENRQILRMLAGQMATALPILEEVRELAPYEPQSLRDIATAQAALGRHQAAVDLLYETARRQWSDRFGEINTIALTEMNAIIAAHGREIKTEGIDSRLIRNLPSDIRVVLSWDMDNTDMDLWVTDPNGEAANYKRTRTSLGGRMSRDCTQGYGPEEFMLKKAVPGLYRVEVDYYGHSRQTISGEVTMIVTVFSKFGTPQQKEEKTSLRLKKTKDRVLVAEFYVEE